ncbi:hypothetical protein M0802_008744 [Mischocyttarus mexicanus]|nr:hypothetical protein M0802_008744 [Mischocyttarus mexicanus]
MVYEAFVRYLSSFKFYWMRKASTNVRTHHHHHQYHHQYHHQHHHNPVLLFTNTKTLALPPLPLPPTTTTSLTTSLTTTTTTTIFHGANAVLVVNAVNALLHRIAFATAKPPPSTAKLRSVH